MPPTDAACRNANCPLEKPRERFADSGGLYFEVNPPRLEAAALEVPLRGQGEAPGDRHLYESNPYTRTALKLMALTFDRTSELIDPRWDEFDLDNAEWRIPAERMKIPTPHIVALATQAIDALHCLMPFRDPKATCSPTGATTRSLCRTARS
jgi:hypothetical protein